MPDLRPPHEIPDIPEPDPGATRRAVEALDSVRRQWLRHPTVGAVDVGFRVRETTRSLELAERPVVRVHLERKLKNLPESEKFPKTVPGFDDVAVDVIEAVYGFGAGRPDADEDGGETADPADSESPLRRSRVAPLMGGVSVGNPRVTAGTLGAVVWRNADGRPHILSNWHVLAGSEGAGCCCGSPGGRSSGQPHYQALAGSQPHYQALAGSQPHYQGIAGSQPHYQALAGAQPHYQALAGLQPHYQALAGAQPHYQGAAAQPHYQLLAGVEPHYQSASSGQPHYQAAAVYEPIYQPGRFDGGTAADAVAVLVDLRLDRHMDAALGRLVGDRPYSAEIWGVGSVTGVEAEPRLGSVVVKSGRSTALTWGLVDGVSASTKIEFQQGEHWFEDQLHIVPLPDATGRLGDLVSEDGDSGSVWVDVETRRAVGLHFAGDRDPGTSEHALANPMWRVAKELDFSFQPTIGSAQPTAVWPPAPWQAPWPPQAPARDDGLDRARRVVELAWHLLR